MTYTHTPRQIPPVPHNDPEPQPCSTCGHTAVPYDQRLSNLLDTVLLLESVVQDLKKAAGEVAQ